VTISIGVAEKNERHTKWDQVVKAADRALYRAKEGGGTRYRPDKGLGRPPAKSLEVRLLDQVVEGEDGALVEQRGDQAERGRGRERQTVHRQVTHRVHWIPEPAIRPSGLGDDPLVGVKKLRQ